MPLLFVVENVVKVEHHLFLRFLFICVEWTDVVIKCVLYCIMLLRKKVNYKVHSQLNINNVKNVVFLS